MPAWECYDLLVQWPWSGRKSAEPTDLTLSVSDPLLAGYFSVGGTDYSGIVVSESNALALSAVWRSVSLISGTLASLPLRTLRDKGNGERERVGSIFDNPGGPDGPTPFSWKETAFAHLLLHGNLFLLHVRNEAGALAALLPVHPLGVTIELPTADDHRTGNLPRGGKWFKIMLDNGERVRLDADDITHVMGLSLDGVSGLSPITVARTSLGTAVAGDRSAAKMFSSGALISGIVSPEDETEPFESTEIKRQLDRNVNGWENAGTIAVVNRRLKFSPWTMSAVDAQFLQSRQFSIEEIARWWGVPPFELMQTEKQTSWGTGIEAQQRGLGRTVLAPWASRFEQSGSRLLANPRFVEFDFSGLERPTPDMEIDLLIKQVTAGLLTLNEARAIRNMPPVPGGDAVKGTTQSTTEGSPGDPAAE